MTVLQAWLVAGLPGLALAAVLFTGRSTWRTAAGYGVLLVTFGVLASVSPPSAAAVGGLGALLHAAGRGGGGERGPDPLARTGVAAAEAAGADATAVRAS